MLTVPAPAKINLTLEVLGKRGNGFHEIRSVMQTINLSDTLSFQIAENINYSSDLPVWIAQESLVSRTVSLLRQVTGCSKGVNITVSKRIPLLSGLGGDSSDAAATLIGLNQLWKLALSQEKLLELAARLGSDVAFFLYRGTALVEGRGEIVTPLPPSPHHWVILLIPPAPRLPGKTKQLYDSLKEIHYTDGQITRRLIGKLREAGEFSPSLLFNVFEQTAFSHFAGLKEYRELFLAAGASDVHLAGSGPALFTLLEDKTQAEQLYLRLRQQKLECYLTDTLSPREGVK